MKERSFKRVFAMLLAIVLIFGDAVILPKQNNDAEAATCNHSYSWVDVVPATCPKEGRRDYMCSKCKNVAQSATLPKVPNHSLVYQYKVSPTCTAKGYDVYKCSECGTVVNQNYKDATGHNYSL